MQRGRRPRYHPSPCIIPPFGIKISNETKPSLPPPLLFFLVSRCHAARAKREGKRREIDRERSHRYPFLPPVMYQACPRTALRLRNSGHALLSGVGSFRDHEWNPSWWRVGSGVADPPHPPQPPAIFPGPEECGNTKQ